MKEEARESEEMEDVELTRPLRTPDARERDVEIDWPPPRDNGGM
jgi:hypothetical protein